MKVQEKHSSAIKKFFASLLVAALLSTIISVPANAATSTATARTKAEKEETYFHAVAEEYAYAIHRGKTTPKTSGGEYVIRNTLENSLVKISLIVRVKNGKVYYTINGQPYWSRAEAVGALAKYASTKAVRTKAEKEETYFLNLARGYGYSATRGVTIPKTGNGEYAIKNKIESKYVSISFIVRATKKSKVYYTINGQPYYSRAEAKKALKKYAPRK